MEGFDVRDKSYIWRSNVYRAHTLKNESVWWRQDVADTQIAGDVGRVYPLLNNAMVPC